MAGINRIGLRDQRPGNPAKFKTVWNLPEDPLRWILCQADFFGSKANHANLSLNFSVFPAKMRARFTGRDGMLLSLKFGSAARRPSQRIK